MKVDTDNKVIQIRDYFYSIRKLKNNISLLNWGWINTWGQQNDASEVISTLVSSCLEDQLKTPVEKYIRYVDNEGNSKLVLKSNNSEVPVIQLNGDYFDDVENVTCQEILNMINPNLLDVRISIYKNFTDVIENYNNILNSNDEKSVLIVSKLNQAISPFGLAYNIVTFAITVYNRYLELLNASMLTDADKLVFESFFSLQNSDGTTINWGENLETVTKQVLDTAYKNSSDELIQQELNSKGLMYDNNGYIIGKKDKSKKRQVIRISKKRLEERVKSNTNELLQDIINFYTPNLIDNNEEIKNLLKRITMNAEYNVYNNAKYLFILPQFIRWNKSKPVKRTDISDKIIYPDYRKVDFDYSGKQYKLIGVCYHSGSGASSGHFVAEVLRSDTLYLCNDSTTKIIDNWKSYNGSNLVPSVFLFERVDTFGDENNPIDVIEGTSKLPIKVGGYKKNNKKNKRKTKKKTNKKKKSNKRKTKKNIKM
tara:strand:- start:966 stop:2411 length:1446 start_codon:yes stop_codon:yes gene_type:complete